MYSFFNETIIGFGFVRTNAETKTETKTSFSTTNTPKGYFQL